MSSPDETVAAVLKTFEVLQDLEVQEHPARFEAAYDALRRLLDGDEALSS